MQNICFLTKFSELSKRAMPSAINIAKKYGAELHELHVLETLGGIHVIECVQGAVQAALRAYRQFCMSHTVVTPADALVH